MQPSRRRPKCRYCRGDLALMQEDDGLTLACLLCGREPARPARIASPALIAQATREAFIRRRDHHRSPNTASGGADA